MFNVLGDVNWLAVIAGALAYYVLGALWFQPATLGKYWERAIGFQRPEGYKYSPLYYVGPLIGSLAAAIAIGLLSYALRVDALGDALLLGVIAGIGVAAAVTFTNAIAPNTPQPLLFAAVTGSYHTAGIVVASIIVYAW